MSIKFVENTSFFYDTDVGLYDPLTCSYADNRVIQDFLKTGSPSRIGINEYLRSKYQFYTHFGRKLTFTNSTTIHDKSGNSCEITFYGSGESFHLLIHFMNTWYMANINGIALSNKEELIYKSRLIKGFGSFLTISVDTIGEVYVLAEKNEQYVREFIDDYQTKQEKGDEKVPSFDEKLGQSSNISENYSSGKGEVDLESFQQFANEQTNDEVITFDDVEIVSEELDVQSVSTSLIDDLAIQHTLSKEERLYREFIADNNRGEITKQEEKREWRKVCRNEMARLSANPTSAPKLPVLKRSKKPKSARPSQEIEPPVMRKLSAITFRFIDPESNDGNNLMISYKHTEYVGVLNTFTPNHQYDVVIFAHKIILPISDNERVELYAKPRIPHNELTKVCVMLAQSGNVDMLQEFQRNGLLFNKIKRACIDEAAKYNQMAVIEALNTSKK